MSGRLVSTLLKQTRQLTQASSAEDDASLVGRFATSRDEAAFAALVHRHSPMVWAVCRNAVALEADAEDAFQATFLALIHQARGLKRRAAVGAWLHATAVRICIKARRASLRRVSRESQVARPDLMPNPRETWYDEVAQVHRAISRLPQREHEVFVLCVLEGLAPSEVATRLGLKPHSVSGLLSRSRRRLQARLAGSISLIVAACCPALLPAALLTQTCRLSKPAAVLSPSVLSLTRSVVEVTMRKNLLIAGLMIALGTALTAGKLLTSSAEAQGQPPAGARQDLGLTYGIQKEDDQARANRDRLVRKGYVPAGELSGGNSGQAWEYKVLLHQANRSMESALNDLGGAGWDVSSMASVEGGSQVVLVLKRPKGSRVAAGTSLNSAPVEAQPQLPSDAGVKLGVGRSEKPGDGSTMKVFRLQQADAVAMAALLKDFNKEGTVAADPRTNSLVVEGKPDLVMRMEALIQKLDSTHSSAREMGAPTKR